MYADDPQSVGHGDVTFEATTFALPLSVFEDTYQAFPPSLGAQMCSIDMASFGGTASQGDEDLAGDGFPNGVIIGTVDACVDIAPAVRSFLGAGNPNEPEQWDEGAINVLGNVVLWDLDVFAEDRTFGLHVVCFRSAVFDLNNALAGVVEDYGYLWVDGPDNSYALAPLWLLPENSDGQAPSQDRSTLGIPLGGARPSGSDADAPGPLIFSSPVGSSGRAASWSWSLRW